MNNHLQIDVKLLSLISVLLVTRFTNKSKVKYIEIEKKYTLIIYII